MLATCFLLNIAFACATSAGQLVDCAEVRAGDKDIATATLRTVANSFFMSSSFLSVSGPYRRPPLWPPLSLGHL